jgi:hypothetical protein
MHAHWYLWLGNVIVVEDPKDFPHIVEQEFQELSPWNLHSLEQDSIDPTPPDYIPVKRISSLNYTCKARILLTIQTVKQSIDIYTHNI